MYPGYIFFVIWKTSRAVWETRSSGGRAIAVLIAMAMTQQEIHLHENVLQNISLYTENVHQ